MARLTTIKPTLQTLRPKLQAPKDEAGRNKFRDANTPGRSMMASRKWRGDDNGKGGLRWEVLARDMFTCQICRTTHGNTRLLEADHIIPHKGQELLFWDAGNLWCVCGQCHSTVCQRIEAQHAGHPDRIRAEKMRAAGRA